MQGDPDQPFTAGFACGKVNRDADLVHSPDRLTTPLRRIGPKGAGPVRADHLGRGAGRDHRALEGDHRSSPGRTRCSGYAYSAHQGQMNRGLVNGLFHALGASRLQPARCATRAARRRGTRRSARSVAPIRKPWSSDLVIAWGADLHATNVHFLGEDRAARNAVCHWSVIDPRRSRTAAGGRLARPIRIGTDAALALGVMHIVVRDGLCDRAYIAAQHGRLRTAGARGAAALHARGDAAITGLLLADIERFAALYGNAKTPFIRLGEGMTRVARRAGNARGRAVARCHRRLRARRRCDADDRGVLRAELRRGAEAVRPGDDAHGQPPALGEALLRLRDPPIRALFISANNPAVTCPDTAKMRAGLAREDLFTVVHDPFLSVTARYADIVLPATTYLETEDFYRATVPITCSMDPARWRRRARRGRTCG